MLMSMADMPRFAKVTRSWIFTSSVAVYYHVDAFRNVRNVFRGLGRLETFIWVAGE
jgi:hypothetical protein